VGTTLLGKGNELWCQLQKWFDDTREVDDQCGAVNGRFDDWNGRRHDDHASTIDAEYAQYLVARAARRGHEQRTVINRPTQLGDPLILTGLTAKRAKVVDRDYKGRRFGWWGGPTRDVYNVNGHEQPVHGQTETAAPER
jgi:hypothetical protein